MKFFEDFVCVATRFSNDKRGGLYRLYYAYNYGQTTNKTNMEIWAHNAQINRKQYAIPP